MPMIALYYTVRSELVICGRSVDRRFMDSRLGDAGTIFLRRLEILYYQDVGSKVKC